MRLGHVLPRIPPAICGVGDQTFILAQTLKEEHGVESEFLAAGHDCIKCEELWPKLENLALRCDAIIVQYSCYGFQKRGVPFHLVRAIRRLRALKPDLPVLTMFHELAATGRITTSAFWFGRIQRYLIAQLARMSTHVRTNRVAYRKELEFIAPTHQGQVISMPIFSNFGESSSPPNQAKRRRSLVLFQPPPYDTQHPYWQAWEKLVDWLDPVEIPIVGRTTTLPSNSLVLPLGVAPSNDVSILLQHSAWGLVDYFPGYLGKSSVFASYAANGVATFAPSDLRGADEGLISGHHYLDVGAIDASTTSERIGDSANALYSWYQSHNQSTTAASYLTQFDF